MFFIIIESIIKFLCSTSEIYVLVANKTNKDLFSNINKENVKVIDFYDEIIKNNDYLMVDKIHLTEKGNKALSQMLVEVLMNNELS